jgi:DNA-binding IclR family transcriptional regulator
MLAWMPSESLDVAFAHTKRYTPLTLTRRKDIERDLDETRARGYSVNRGEFRVGVCGIGVPVRDRTGGVIAAIGVWGAEKNILGARRDELAHMAVIAARDVSRDLGFIEAQAAAPAKREPAEALA